LDGIALTTQRCIAAFTADARFGLFFFAVAFAIAGTITARAVATGAITTRTIATGAITARAIATGSITAITIVSALPITAAITGIGVVRRGVIAAAHLDLRIAGLGRFFRTESAVPDVTCWALVLRIRRRRFVRVLLAARRAGVYMRVFRALKTVSLVLQGLKDTGRLTAFINVHITNNVLKSVLTGSRANRARRRDILGVADRVFAFMLVKNGDLVSSFAGVRFRRYAFAGCGVVFGIRWAGRTRSKHINI